MTGRKEAKVQQKTGEEPNGVHLYLKKNTKYKILGKKTKSDEGRCESDVQGCPLQTSNPKVNIIYKFRL